MEKNYQKPMIEVLIPSYDLMAVIDYSPTEVDPEAKSIDTMDFGDEGEDFSLQNHTNHWDEEEE